MIGFFPKSLGNMIDSFSMVAEDDPLVQHLKFYRSYLANVEKVFFECDSRNCENCDT